RHRDATRLLGALLVEDREIELESLEVRFPPLCEADDLGVDLLDLDPGSLDVELCLEKGLRRDAAPFAEASHPVEHRFTAFEVDAQQVAAAAGLPYRIGALQIEAPTLRLLQRELLLEIAERERRLRR